jgi:hypothetical protein
VLPKRREVAHRILCFLFAFIRVIRRAKRLRLRRSLHRLSPVASFCLTNSARLVNLQRVSVRRGETPYLFEMNVEYTDAPPTRPNRAQAHNALSILPDISCPKDAQSCDRCDWKRGTTATNCGRQSKRRSGSYVQYHSGIGTHLQGTYLVGFLWMACAVPVGIFVFWPPSRLPGGVSVSFLLPRRGNASCLRRARSRHAAEREDEGEEY